MRYDMVTINRATSEIRQWKKEFKEKIYDSSKTEENALINTADTRLL